MVETASHRIVRFDWRNKIARYQTRALMNELIECVLTIGARLAPHYRTCTIVDFDGNISPDDIDHYLDIILKNGDYCMNARILGRFAEDGKYIAGDPRDTLNKKITK